MKRILTFASSALLLMVGCSRENTLVEGNSSDKVNITVDAGIAQVATKGSVDYDGNAKQVNHWVMEVRDKDGKLFIRQEKDATKGTLTQKFTFSLFKNNSYTFQFWADNKGCYNTADLTAVSASSTVANDDARDAFCTNVEYTSSKSESLSATLYRPFAQLNVQTTDLDSMWKHTVSPEEYYAFKPVNFVAKAKVPTNFNVKTQTAGTASSEITFTSDECYYGYKTDSLTVSDSTTFYRHVNPATLYMDYVFASTEKTLVDVNFAFTTNGSEVTYAFTSIPFQRNYRTNIKGKLMSHDTEWTVTIDPLWKSPEFDIIK